jgi:hypothetical protein
VTPPRSPDSQRPCVAAHHTHSSRRSTKRPYCFVAVATRHVTPHYRYISKWRHTRPFEWEIHLVLWRHLLTAEPPVYQRNQRRYHVKNILQIHHHRQLPRKVLHYDTWNLSCGITVFREEKYQGENTRGKRQNNNNNNNVLWNIPYSKTAIKYSLIQNGQPTEQSLWLLPCPWWR